MSTTTFLKNRIRGKVIDRFLNCSSLNPIQNRRNVYTMPHLVNNTPNTTLHRGSSATGTGEPINKSETIFVHKKRDVKQIFLNNPRNLNRLTPRITKQLHKELIKGILNPINKMVVLRSTGATHMIGGTDLPALYDMFYGPVIQQELEKNIRYREIDLALQNVALYLKDLYSLATTLIHSTRIIPLWNGYSLIPLPNSLICPAASYHVPHLQYGFGPDLGSTWLLAQLDLKYPGVAMYMALFSASKSTILDCKQLSALGIGQGEVNEGTFDQVMQDYQSQTATLEPLEQMLRYACTPTLANNLEKIDPAGVGVKTGYGFDTINIVKLPLEDINEYFGPFTNPKDNSKDHMNLEDFMQVLERDSVSLIAGSSKREWCKQMLDTLRSGSLEVAGGVFAMMKNIRGRSFSDCCTLEYRLLHRLLHNRQSDTHRALQFLHNFSSKHDNTLMPYQSYVDPKIWKTGKDIIKDFELKMNEPLSWTEDRGIDIAMGGPMEMESMRKYMENLENFDPSKTKNVEGYMQGFHFEIVDTIPEETIVQQEQQEQQQQ
jgi:hypothetical protein